MYSVWFKLIELCVDFLLGDWKDASCEDLKNMVLKRNNILRILYFDNLLWDEIYGVMAKVLISWHFYNCDLLEFYL